MAEQGVDESAVRISGGRMDHHAGRLVDDDQICILKADIELDRLRYRCRIFIIGDNYDEILVAPHTQSGVAQRCSVICDKAGFDQPLDPRAGYLREVEREHTIEPQPDVGLARADYNRSARIPAGGVEICRHRQVFMWHILSPAFSTLKICVGSKSW